MAKPKTPKQLDIKMKSLSKQLKVLEAKKKKLVVAKRKPAKRKAVKKKVVKKKKKR